MVAKRISMRLVLSLAAGTLIGAAVVVFCVKPTATHESPRFSLLREYEEFVNEINDVRDGSRVWGSQSIAMSGVKLAIIAAEATCETQLQQEASDATREWSMRYSDELDSIFGENEFIRTLADVASLHDSTCDFQFVYDESAEAIARIRIRGWVSESSVIVVVDGFDPVNYEQPNRCVRSRMLVIEPSSSKHGTLLQRRVMYGFRPLFE